MKYFLLIITLFLSITLCNCGKKATQSDSQSTSDGAMLEEATKVVDEYLKMNIIKNGDSFYFINTSNDKMILTEVKNLEVNVSGEIPSQTELTEAEKLNNENPNEEWTGEVVLKFSAFRIKYFGPYDGFNTQKTFIVNDIPTDEYYTCINQINWSKWFNGDQHYLHIIKKNGKWFGDWSLRTSKWMIPLDLSKIDFASTGSGQGE